VALISKRVPHEVIEKARDGFRGRSPCSLDHDRRTVPCVDVLSAGSKLGGNGSCTTADISCSRTRIWQLAQQETVVEAAVVPVKRPHAHIIAGIGSVRRSRLQISVDEARTCRRRSALVPRRWLYRTVRPLQLQQDNEGQSFGGSGGPTNSWW